MTNGWIDIKNTDMMLIMGGNPAENHPCGFKWPIEAKLQRNAKMIVVDPRFTRTAATADLFLQIRAGADIAFLGGLINYAIENGRIARDYLVNYTNASFIVQEGFKLPEDGLYSGFDPATQIYDKSTWNYEAALTGSARATAAARRRARDRRAAASTGRSAPGARAHRGRGAGGRRRSRPTSPTIHRCSIRARVFQLLKRQYSRYTPEMVERITGIPKDQFLKAADLFTSVRKDGDMKKVATIIYAVGWTQHTLRHADHPHGGDPAAAARQRRPRRRRRQRPARPLQHPGRHRHGGRLRHPARLPEDADARTTSTSPTYVEAHHADRLEARGVGLVQLLVEHAEVRRVVPQGDVRRRRHARRTTGPSTICRRSIATTRGREIWDDMYTGSIKGLFAFGMNGVADRPQLRGRTSRR